MVNGADQRRIRRDSGCVFLQKLRLSPPKLPSAQELSGGEVGLCSSAGPLRPVLPTQHSAMSRSMRKFFVQVEYYYYYLFIDYLYPVLVSFILFLSSLNEVCPFASICFGLRCCALVRHLLVLNVVYITFKSDYT